MRRLELASTLAIGLILVLTQVAFAHERRMVGKYELVVGFANEPAYVGIPNSLDLRVTDTETQKPVEGLEKTIQSQVVFGGRTMPLQLRARFGQPGAYLADFIPTRTGTYIFHLTGQIENTKLDEEFESGPGRFNDVQDTSTAQFPERVPAPLDMAAQVRNAQDTAARAQTFALAGIVVGVLGLIIGGLGWLRRK